MNGAAERIAALEAGWGEVGQACGDEYLRSLFDSFADHVDSDMQNALFSELVVRYADVSRQLEEKNRTLGMYNDRLEALVREKMREISAAQTATIHALIKSAESRDDETGAHIERTSAYCALIAKKLRETGAFPETVSEAFIETIATASPLHDIGKIGIKDAILLKPGRLTPEEFEVMKTHVLIGYETLASVATLHPENAFLRIGMEISRNHHEKWDGSGYTRGLAGEEIPLSARIMAISDVYDALRSRRAYKEPYTHGRAIAIIAEGRATHFDPVLVDAFLGDDLAFRDIFDRLTAEE